MRWVAPDLAVHDRSVVAIFAADDGSYVDEPVGDALRPPSGDALYTWTDLPVVCEQDDDEPPTSTTSTGPGTPNAGAGGAGTQRVGLHVQLSSSVR